MAGALGPARWDEFGAAGGVVIVDTSCGRPPHRWRPGSVPIVVIGVVQPGTHLSDRGHVSGDPYDVIVADGDPMLAAIVEQIEQHPIAATSLALLLRGGEARSVHDGLIAESAAYSTLQSGSEFAAWRSTRSAPAPSADELDPVLVDRVGADLVITLNRPHRHNAVSSSLRQGLVEALTVAAVDDSVATVRLIGNGPSFCSGGDLAEFGSFPDPAAAHLARLASSPARLIHALRNRLTVELRGACMGAGIELASFASTVVAAPDTVIALPEITLGLIPGAGGTVSIPLRIGRHRTALLALSGAPIDAATALEWGLVDEIR